MRLRFGLLGLVALTLAGAWALAGPIPPGRQHRLTIEGTNTITFLPRAGLDPLKIEYQAKVEYIVDTCYGKETKAAADDDVKPLAEESDSKKPVARKGKSAKTKEAPAPKATGAIDLSLHSSEMVLRQGGRPMIATKMSRTRFQGRIQADSPILDLSAKDAPPRLQEFLKNYDVVAASLLLNDDLKVVDRKYRIEGQQRAILETLLSIHTPIPRGVDSWESPTQLAMGQGNTAKGKLRFDQEKKGSTPSTDLVKVKVSGVLKAEGVVAGNFIKDGTYTVTGEQVFDSHTHEWVRAKWSVEVVNELANQGGLTVAHANGTMTVNSRVADESSIPISGSDKPKL